MKTIKKTLLHFHQGTSNKVYNVYLIEVSPESYLVNFEYGRYGATLREGTKTSSPVALKKAQKLYDSLVVSKVNKEYKIVSGYNSMTKEEKSQREVLSNDAYASLLIERLKRASEERLKSVDNYAVSRLIYRAGALKLEDAKPYIVTLYSRSIEEDNAFYYSVAWALGRYKDEALRSIMISLREKLNDASKYIIEEALFLLGDEREAKEIRGLDLPMPFKVSIKNESLESFITQVEILEEMIDSTYGRYKNIDSWYEEERKAIKGELDPLLEQADELYLKLYIQASIDPHKHEAMVKAMAFLPINEFNFSLFRRLYKMADMRDDHAVLAKLITKIESKKMACYEVYEWESDNKRSLGCSRLYFKKRSLRYLKNLAMNDSASYVEFSKNILLSMNSQVEAFAPFKTEYYDNDWNLKTKKYDAFAVHLTFMYILYGAGKRYMMAPSKKMWEIANKSIHDEQRVEMHKEIWDKYPEVALEILAKSLVAEVQEFSFAIIEEHPEVIKSASLEQLLPMLNAHADKAREFFFALLKKRYDETKEEAIITACLLSSDDNIALYALEIVAEKTEILYTKNLVVEATFSTSKYIFNRLIPLLKTLENPSSIVEEVLRKLMKTSLPLDAKVRLRTIEIFRALHRGVEVKHLEAMMREEKISDYHLIASKLIRCPEFDSLELSLALKEKIASYQDPSMLATTIYLLGKLSDEELMKEYRMLVTFLYHEEPQVSSEAMKILKVLGAKEQGNAETILEELVERSFASTPEPTAENVVSVVESFESVYGVINIDQLYRLLIAKSKLALRIGNLLLQKQKAENFSVLQWAKLAKNPNKSIRVWAYDAYINNPKMVKKSMPKSLMIFDTSWEDTRAFASAYFESFEPLRADDIVVIADSNYNDVQQFAKKMIQERDFDNESIMLKLSQHPALSIQKFVTDLMLSDIRVEQLVKMERFFNTLLHSVNQNRVAKTRVLNILNNFLSHREIAEMYARLASHHSASMVWADKSAYVEAMVNISEYYGDIELPLEIQELEIKEVSHGV